VSQGLLIHEVPRSHTKTQVGFLWTSDQPDTETTTWQHTTLSTDKHPCPMRNSNPQFQLASDHRPTHYTAWPLGPAHNLLNTYIDRSRDTIVGIATRYGLEGPGIESQWGEIFRTYPDRLRGPPSLLYNGYGVFPGRKGGRGVMLTTHPLLVPRLRKSWAIPPLTLMGPPGPVTGFPLPLTYTDHKLPLTCRCSLV
jgi:hypothetical protein